MHPRLSLAITTALLGLTPAAFPAAAQQAVREGFATARSGEAGAVFVPAGRYYPLYSTGADSAGIAVEAFRLDVRPVTVGEFLSFLRATPAWRKDAAAEALAGPGYLSRWPGPLDPGAAPLDRPVTEVSWFAARAYCRWSGGRLPTTDEWEYAAQAGETTRSTFRDATANQRVLRWLQGRAPADALPPVGTTDQNVLGLRDLHGLVWEWTADFNNQMLTGAGRDDRGLDRGLFCASGSVGTTDLSNYAAFLRWAHRTSLEGATSSPGLGFRCAR